MYREAQILREATNFQELQVKCEELYGILAKLDIFKAQQISIEEPSLVSSFYIVQVGISSLLNSPLRLKKPERTIDGSTIDQHYTAYFRSVHKLLPSGGRVARLRPTVAGSNPNPAFRRER